MATATRDRAPPVWLLDVDGVINATRPGWGSPPRRASVYADGGDWPMRWAPALIDRLRGLHEDGAVEPRWCSTWCAGADRLERLWRLPPLVRAFCERLVDLAAARQVLADRRPLIWTDDTEVPRIRAAIRRADRGRSRLLIAPARGAACSRNIWTSSRRSPPRYAAG